MAKHVPFRSNPTQWRPRGNRNLDKQFRPQRVIVAADGSTRINPLDALYTYMSAEGPRPVNTTGCFGTMTTGCGVNRIKKTIRGNTGKRREMSHKGKGLRLHEAFYEDWNDLLKRRRRLHCRIIRGHADAREIRLFLTMTKRIEVGNPALYQEMVKADVAREKSMVRP